MKNRSVKIGTVYEIQTFAGVNVHARITSIDTRCKGVYSGVLVRKEDIDSLIAAGVPYEKNHKLSDTESCIYDYQIIKRVNKRSGEQKRTGNVIRRKKKK